MQENRQEKSLIKRNILQYLDFKGISQYEYYKLTGTTRGILSQNNGISEDNMMRFLDYFPDVNPYWLITGKGDMIKSDLPQVPINGTIETRPRIPLNVAAGALTISPDGVTYNQCEQIPVISAFTRYDFTIFVSGESMEPEYKSGDELACLYIKNTSFIQWGRAHVLDTAQGVIVKRIYDDDDEYILCESENSRFKDFRIRKNEIYNIALVIGLLRRY